MPLNWLTRTPYAVVETRARVFADQIAVVIPAEGDLQPTEISYSDLHGGIQRTARHLAGAGIGLGAHVAIWAENSLEWLECWLAASLIGAVTVAINPRLTGREAAELMDATDTTHLLVGGRPIGGAVELMESGRAPAATFAIDGSAALPSLGAHDSPYREAPLDGTRVGLIQFTSGSTGMPKGVQLREGAVAALGASCASRWLLHPGDRMLGVFSLAHNAGSTFTTMPTFTAGAALVLTGWSGGAGAELAQRTGVTVLPGLDTIVGDLLSSGVRPRELRAFVGGFDAATAQRLVDELGVEVANTYGLTEITANVATGDLRDSQQLRIDRIGVPHPGNAARIVDDRGVEASAGVQGEIQVTGWARMKGYYGVAPEQQPFTADGWVRTGDKGTIDEHGYLQFMGRTKDVIRSGGENVAAFEIERFLESHPDVLQAAVVPAPDPRFGEVPFAFVRLRPGTRHSGQELIDHCRGRLAKFKIPAHVEVVASFPLVGINKVSKAELRERAAGHPPADVDSSTPKG
jgi:fatty-acyl-CoA synthase